MRIYPTQSLSSCNMNNFLLEKQTATKLLCSRFDDDVFAFAVST